MHPDDTVPCFRSYMGLWAIEPVWMRQAVQALQMGLVPMRAVQAQEIRREQGKLYSQTADGVAIIRLEGPIIKGLPKFAEGTSAVLTRRAIRQAVADETIVSLLLKVDSPGGQVDGIQDLADEVTRARESKVVDAYLEDFAASAAYWIASQARRITANIPAWVGSIGAFAVLHDLSGLAEREGITVTVVSTGPYKGMGVPGTPVTPAMVADVQRMVDQIGAFFFAAVQQGRRLTETQMRAVTDGRLWIASEARALGLIDEVGTFEEALDASRQQRPRRTHAEARAELARLRAAIAEGASVCRPKSA